MNSPGRIGLALSALLAAGCASYAPPSLVVAEARPRDQTSAGVVLDFAIDATNPNPVELPLKEVRYTLTLDGREVFRGVRSPEASLRRLGTQRFHIPAAVPFAGAPPAVPARYTLRGEVLYITPGQLAQALFDIKVRRPTVGFHGEGTVALEAEN